MGRCSDPLHFRFKKWVPWTAPVVARIVGEERYKRKIVSSAMANVQSLQDEGKPESIDHARTHDLRIKKTILPINSEVCRKL